MKKVSTFTKALIHIKITVLILISFTPNLSYSQQFERVYANTVQKSADEYLLGLKTGYVVNENLAADNNTSTFATLNSTVVQVAFIELGGEAVIRLRFTGPDKPSPNTPVTIKLGIGGNLVTALGGLTVQAINGNGNSAGNGGEVGPRYIGTSLVNLISGKNQIEFTITPTQAYDGVKIKLGDTGGLLSVGLAANLDVYHAYFLKPATDNIICESVTDSLYGSTGILAGGLNPVQQPSLAFDKNEDTYASLRTNAGVLNSTFLTGVYSSLSKTGDSIKLVLQSENAGLLDLSLLSALTVQTFENNTLAQNFALNSPLLNLQLLTGGSNKYLLTLPTTTPFNRIRLSIGGVANVLAGLRAYEISRTAASPVITNPGLSGGSLTACEGSPVSFTINNPETEATYKWFNDPINGNEITTGISNNGSTFSPIGLTAGTYDYYVALYRNGCLDPVSARSKVTLIITPGAQPADITASGTTICVGENAMLAAPVLANANITSPLYKWYLDANRTTQITDGTIDGLTTYTLNPDGSLSIAGLRETRDYYISVSGSNTCENAPGNLKVVTVTVNTIAQPVLNLTGDQTIGPGGSITLTASSANATSYQWFKGITPISGAVSNTLEITTDPSTGAGEYTVIAYGAGGCASLVSAMVKINIGGFGSTKSVSGLTADGRIAAGAELTYTIRVTNTGTLPLNNVTIADKIPDGTTYLAGSADNGGTFNTASTTLNWTLDVSAASFKEVSFKVKVNEDLTNTPSIENTAVITNPADSGNPQTATVPPVNTIQVRDFSASKTVEGLNSNNKIDAGATLTYKITVNNTGNVGLTGITITDMIPEGTTYVSGTATNSGIFDDKKLSWAIDVPFGGTQTVSFDVKVADNLTGITAIGNTATVSIPTHTETPTVLPIDTEQTREFSATKSVSGLNPDNKIVAGSELTFTITVQNTGNTDLSGIIISDPVPAGTSYITGSADNSGALVNGIVNWALNIPSGATRSVLFKVRVNDDLTGIAAIGNTAVVTDPTDPTNPETPTVPPVDTEQIRSFSSSKSVTGINTDGKIHAGSELTYTITITNTGNVALTGITVKDPIPLGTAFIAGSANFNGIFENNTLTWTDIDVPYNESVNISFKVRVNDNLTGFPSIGNKATVTDPENPNNPQEPEVPPTNTDQIFNFDLSSTITTANGGTKAAPNEELTVAITVTNTGNTQLGNIIISNPIPDNTTFLSTSNGGSYDNTNKIISFTINPIAVGQSETVTFKVATNQDLVNVQSIDNTANVVANGIDKSTSASILVECPTLTATNVTANGSTGGNICANSTNSIEIVATSNGVIAPVYYLYENNILVGSNNSGIFSLTLSPSQTAYSYSVGISGSGFCETPVPNRKTITFTIIPLPETPGVITNNVSTCNNTPVQLAVANPQSSLTYNWYLSANGGTVQGTGSTFNTPAITANTSYFVEAVAAGCASSTRTEVTISTINLPAAPAGAGITNGPLCSGSSAILTVNDPQPGILYRWYSNLTGGTALGEGNTFTTGNINNNTTFYIESVAASTSCVSNTRYPIEVTVLPVLTAPIVSLESKTINSITFRWTAISGAVNYERSTDGGTTWLPTGTATSYTFTGLKPAENVSLMVRAIGTTSCQTSIASNNLTETSDNPLGNEVFIPNTFTPNNDGNNDFFLAYGNTINNINMRIYNQWGQFIFQSVDPSRGWDGTYKGQNQPTGVYIYNIELTFKDGTSTTKKGTITLIR
jgi:gliding motility-associated-like protein/uncharacterized repeat protein (TIGR01451 family)